METEKIIGLLIGFVAVAGGLVIGAISIYVSVPLDYKARLAKLDARNKERLALIEKGFDPALVFKNEKSAGADPLFWGLLMVGIGLGIFVGYLLHLLTDWNNYILTNSMAILFGGIGLILYHFYRKKAGDKQTV